MKSLEIKTNAKVPMKRNCLFVYFKVYLSKLKILKFEVLSIKLWVLQAFEVGLFLPSLLRVRIERSLAVKRRSSLRSWKAEPVELQKFKQSAKN